MGTDASTGNRLRPFVRSVAAALPPFDRILARRHARAERAQQERRRRVDVASARSGGAAFLQALVNDGDVELASVALVRTLLDERTIGRARTVAQTLQLNAALAHVGDVCQAIIAVHDRHPERAWSLLCARDVDTVLRLAPSAYFRAGFQIAPDIARAVLQRAHDGELAVNAGARDWLDIARTSFVAGEETLSRWALDTADTTRGGPALSRDIAWLRNWYGRAGQPAPPPPDGEIPFAVLDYKQPSRAHSSENLGDPVQTLASLGHLARRRRVRFTGEPTLASFTTDLQTRIKPTREVDGAAATLRLYQVDRDASSYAAVPEGTWLFAFGWYMHPTFRMGYDFPFAPALRPIFISFHVNTPRVLTPTIVDYLRAHAPIGCRDWNTVHLLQAAHVPAFFSGCITTTIDTVLPAQSGMSRRGTLYVDTPATGPGETLEQEFDAVRTRSLVANLTDALYRVQSYRDKYEQVVTSRLHCYLPARSIGARVEFRPKNASNVRLDGLAGISDDEFERMRQGILTKLDALLDAITRGASEAEVYEVWRAACRVDVERAEQRRRSMTSAPVGRLDVARACRAIRERAVVIERAIDARTGPELNVEFSLDGNLKRQLEVVLHSIESRASRPLRAYVMCREHTAADFARLARRFPTVSFVWLPTDAVDYGELTGMINHITVATMDRLLLPDLLPDVDRIVHHDLDALCLADLAELYDIDLEGTALAARTSPHPDFLSGFTEFIRASERMPVELAREFIARTHAAHDYDFEIFNAGIMVLDLARMRRDDFCRAYLAYATRYGLNDQAVLNAYVGPHYVALDPAWNWHPRLELMAAPKIAHWAGPLKPWGTPWVQGKQLWRSAEAELEKGENGVGVAPRTSPATAALT
jgi:lipopolysaccharide biosynthesis glycosyltransferase